MLYDKKRCRIYNTLIHFHDLWLCFNFIENRMERLQVDGFFQRRSNGNTFLLVKVDNLIPNDGEV